MLSVSLTPKASLFQMLPSNKFLLYDHSLRIPMVIMGPGISPNTTNEFLGTQVDLAPTMLGLAGIATPPYMDGKSLVSLLVPPQNLDAAVVPPSVREHALAIGAPPSRVASFHQYYNQGVCTLPRSRRCYMYLFTLTISLLQSANQGRGRSAAGTRSTIGPTPTSAFTTRARTGT